MLHTALFTVKRFSVIHTVCRVWVNTATYLLQGSLYTNVTLSLSLSFLATILFCRIRKELLAGKVYSTWNTEITEEVASSQSKQKVFNWSGPWQRKWNLCSCMFLWLPWFVYIWLNLNHHLMPPLRTARVYLHSFSNFLLPLELHQGTNNTH